MRMPLAILFASLFVAAPLLAQQPPPTAPPAVQTPPAAPPAQNRPPAPSSFTNIRLDLTITDTYADKPSSRTVSMIVVDRERSSIRTSNRLPNGPNVQLNVDAYASLLADRGNRILVRLTFEYTPAQASAGAESRGAIPAELTESLSVVLENGQKLVVSQSADPVTDRKVTVEVTATVLK